MKFSELTKVWEEIEATASRNEKTEILSRLLKNSGGENEIAAVVNLSLGRLRPAWEGVEFALADKQVIKGIAMFFGRDVVQIESEYRKLGDLGELIYRMDEGAISNGLDVTDVALIYLDDLAKISGKGSVEAKLAQLMKIFGLMDAVERKYLVRIVLGKLRLGFSDQTVIDALSYMLCGDKSLSKKIEAVYNATPDIAAVASGIEGGGEKYLEKPFVVPGVPVIPMLCQRLKSPKEMVKKMGEVAVEAKFDGTRVQIHFDGDKVATFTRNLEKTTEMFPELKDIRNFVNAKSIVLDAEAVAVEKESGKILPFQVTITRKRKHDIDEVSKEIPLRFYIFDILELDGVTVMDKSYKDRRELLEKAIIKNEILVVDDYRVTSDPDEIEKWHREYLDMGLEGVIVKKLDSQYIPGRTGWNWVKMKEVEDSHAKLADTIDGVIMGYYSGKGKRSAFGIGAFLIGVRSEDKILTLAKIGTGLSDELFKELFVKLSSLAVKTVPDEYIIDKNMMPDVLVEPKVVVEVAADEITKSPIHTAGVALRFPRLIKIREDKDVASATSIEELKDIKQG